jgi:hypothetical protein
MKILITNGSFGFEQGSEYTATIQDGGYFANNGSLGKFISSDDALIIKELDPKHFVDAGSIPVATRHIKRFADAGVV